MAVRAGLLRDQTSDTEGGQGRRCVVTNFVAACAVTVVLGLAAMAPAGAERLQQAVAPGSSAAAVVISGAEGALPQGTLLRADSHLSLRDGASLRLIDRAGQLVVIDGPFYGPLHTKLSAVAPGSSDAAFRAVSTLFAEQKKTGTLRSAGPKPLPAPWLASVHRSGTVCATGDALTLWRGDSLAASPVEIVIGARKARAGFPEGADRLALPSRALADGQSLTIHYAGSQVQLTVRIAPSGASPVEIAAWMASTGCTEQAVALLESL